MALDQLNAEEGKLDPWIWVTSSSDSRRSGYVYLNLGSTRARHVIARSKIQAAAYSISYLTKTV